MKVLLVKAGLNRLLTVYLTVAQVGAVVREKNALLNALTHIQNQADQARA